MRLAPLEARNDDDENDRDCRVSPRARMLRPTNRLGQGADVVLGVAREEEQASHAEEFDVERREDVADGLRVEEALRCQRDAGQPDARLSRPQQAGRTPKSMSTVCQTRVTSRMSHFVREPEKAEREEREAVDEWCDDLRRSARRVARRYKPSR